MLIRTFLDSGVLITAHRGEAAGKRRALAILQDRDRIFLTSPFLYIETVPKAVFFKRESEISFYRIYFSDPSVEWCNDLSAIHSLALRESQECGLAAMDAFHVAAAHLLRADELITTERAEKSIHRAPNVKIVQL
jgi:predicted nucleic acid-binding protein